MQRHFLLLQILVLFKIQAYGSYYVFTDPITKIKIHNGNGKIHDVDSLSLCDSVLFTETVKIIMNGIRKYPPEIIKNHLKRIFIYKSLCKNEICYGGLYARKEIYITHRDGLVYIENILHHEINSILMYFYGNRLDKISWLESNPVNFKYWDITQGIEYIKRYKTSIPSFDTTYLDEGFLSNYSRSSFDNDLSRYAENIFLSKSEFWEAVDKYNLVKIENKNYNKFLYST